jgi:CDP-ribitol ribitolphosphotransferase
VAALRARYDLQPGARLLLYAPTFRADPRDARHPQELDLKAVRDGLAPDWRLLLRLHPLVRSADRTPDDLAGFVVDVSDWPDMNELLLVADMLVTDYSSAVFEYALLGRPIAFFAPDVEAYEAERGFYLEVPEGLPGPLFTTTSALVDHVRSAHADLDRIHEFARTWFDVADGQATERFVERIVRPALRGERVEIEPEPAADERRVLPVPGA